jgi:hypothetical protein
MNSIMRIYPISAACRLIAGDRPSAWLCCSCETRRACESIDVVSRGVLLPSEHQGFIRAPASNWRLYQTPIAKQTNPIERYACFTATSFNPA